METYITKEEDFNTELERDIFISNIYVVLKVYNKDKSLHKTYIYSINSFCDAKDVLKYVKHNHKNKTFTVSLKYR